MDRRSFLKLSALTGLAVATPIGAGLTRKVWAEAQAYGGPFFVLVNASGGYDPIFLPEGETHTMAELTPEQKHRISHRGRAAKALAAKLR